MIDTQTTHQSAKINWIKRLLKTNDSKCKTQGAIYADYFLHARYTFINYYPTTLYEILNQYIANNQNLKIQGNLITNQTFKIELDKLKIYIMIDERGKFLSNDLLNQKFKPISKHNN